MPAMLLKHIYYVSSEDKGYPASNLLRTVNKKWKCKENGEKSVSVIFELDEPTIFTGVDIGNEHSAYVQVLVNKKGGKDSDYEELLLTSSFMTPLESRNSTNPNRVRCFSENTLVGDVAEKKWNLIKVICTQPYNKHVQYGLSFIRFHSSKPGSDSQSSNSSTGSRVIQLGKFKMREESPDTSDSEGLTSTSLFSRWKNTSSTSLVKDTAATEIKKASTSLTRSSPSPSFINRNKISDKKNTSISLADTDDAGTKESKKARNMNRLFYDDDEEVSNERLEKKLEHDKLVKDKEKLEREKVQKDKKDSKQQTQPQQIKRTGEEKMKNSMSKFKAFVDDKDRDPEPSTSTATTSEPRVSTSPARKPATPTSSSKDDRTPKRRSSPSPQNKPPQETKKPKLSVETPKIYKPFKKLMEGITLAISGIQNPERSDLRQKALDLGARYKPDWDDNCTHLICAFKGTPKYNQVKQANGKIVSKKWIHDSHDKRMKYPWRRYALDSYDQKLQESDEEIYDEKLAPKKTETVVPTSQTSESDANILDMYDNSPEYDTGEDTEEELERVKKESISAKAKPNNILGDQYDISTDDELQINSQSSQIGEPFFKGLKFHLNIETLSSTDLIKIKHLIKVYQGELCEDPIKSDFIVTNKRISKPNQFVGEIIKPLWIFESHDMESKLPIKRYKFDS